MICRSEESKVSSDRYFAIHTSSVENFMDLIYYTFLLLIGIIMVIVANGIKKRTGADSKRSTLLLTIGTTLIVVTVAEKLPEVARAILSLWNHD